MVRIIVSSFKLFYEILPWNLYMRLSIYYIFTITVLEYFILSSNCNDKRNKIYNLYMESEKDYVE